MPSGKAPVQAVRQVLKSFQDGYTARDLKRLDEFMTLFDQDDPGIELIGIGAVERGGYEWFIGIEAVGDIIQGDWEYWGTVHLDVEGAEIKVIDRVAWLSTTGSIEQTETHAKALPIYLDQMQAILADPDRDPDEKLLEASHFGVRRLRERLKGPGYRWPFVFTAVLVQRASGWKFNTIHWSMPVD